jgi:hypothetical protein
MRDRPGRIVAGGHGAFTLAELALLHGRSIAISSHDCTFPVALGALSGLSVRGNERGLPTNTMHSREWRVRLFVRQAGPWWMQGRWFHDGRLASGSTISRKSNWAIKARCAASSSCSIA